MSLGNFNLKQGSVKNNYTSKSWILQMLLSWWNNRSAHSLLVGMQNNAPSGRQLSSYHKAKLSAMLSSNYNFRYLLKLTLLFVIAKTWKKPRYMRGDPTKKQNYLLGWALVVQVSPTKWVFQEPTCVSEPAGIVVRVYIKLQWICFWRIFQQVCPFHHGWFMSTPVYTTQSVQQLLTRNSYDPCVLLFLVTWSRSEWLLLFPQMKKFLKGKYFANVEEVKQNMAEAPKGIKIYVFKNFLSSGKNASIGVLHEMESTLKVTEV